LLKKYEGIKSGDSRHERADYAALIEGEDQAIARVLKFLDESGLAGNTLVLFTSDNGGAGGMTANTPLREVKGTFYEGGLRVPMIARWPGVIKAGAVSDAMVNVVDLYPTFAEFAGAKLPEAAVHQVDGVSFANVLRGEATESGRKVMYYHFPGYLDTRAYPCSVIIKRVEGGKEYKLIYSYEDRHYELYDLTDDLGEKHDLLAGGKAGEGDRKIAEDLREDLCQWLKKVPAIYPKDPGTGKDVPMPVEIEEAMKGGNVIKRVAVGKGEAED
jgi:arylsulfatase A-like enzyme